MAISVPQGDVIKVVSFNLRRDFGPQRKNRWESRKELAARMIAESDAAIIGVQEFLPKMRQDLKTLLDGYSIFGKGRLSGKDPGNDEHSDIIIKNNDVEVASCTTFWLSKHPDVPSRAYFAVYPRICTVAEVKIKKSGRRLRVFNTHFDHVSPFARTFGAKMILEQIHRFNQTDPLPTIVMGDFNAKPNSKAVRTMRENLHGYQNVKLQDIYGFLDQLIGNTYHGFTGKIKQKFKPIDYIFVSDDFEVVKASVEITSYDGMYPSDHYPVSAVLRLKPQTAEK
ncbi:MAG: endonuclease/exonuclease/phosphatase family protein [Negativibacillus massiliensis]|uniref:endonuclease/exonuclease/phosphatase family protein n=1 Tax=Negativibacillus massiliensis TaxID=1871035 RepID=UPI0023F749C6|nr:endonuclease/exonuclease/phosphatase family protein [Negativibacillus massiliensis]